MGGSPSGRCSLGLGGAVGAGDPGPSSGRVTTNQKASGLSVSTWTTRAGLVSKVHTSPAWQGKGRGREGGAPVLSTPPPFEFPERGVWGVFSRARNGLDKSPPPGRPS